MNFIQRLKQDIELHQQVNEVAQQQITDLLAFLHSDKFTGTENGERKDWVSTGDVIVWLQNLRSTLQVDLYQRSEPVAGKQLCTQGAGYCTHEKCRR